MKHLFIIPVEHSEQNVYDLTKDECVIKTLLGYKLRVWEGEIPPSKGAQLLAPGIWAACLPRYQ